MPNWISTLQRGRGEVEPSMSSRNYKRGGAPSDSMGPAVDCQRPFRQEVAMSETASECVRQQEIVLRPN